MHVHLLVEEGLLEGRANPRRRRKVDNRGYPHRLFHLVVGTGIPYVRLDETKTRVGETAPEIGPLDRLRVEVVEVVHADTFVPFREKSFKQMGADEARPSRNENPHVFLPAASTGLRSREKK